MGFIKNQIVYKTSEGDKKLEQVVTFRSDAYRTADDEADILFGFEGTFGEGESATQKTIFTIEKDSSEVYYVRIKESEIFKNADGKTLESLGIEKIGEDYILKIDPSSPAVSMRNKGEELIVEVASTDGKVYKITASGTDISIEYGEDKFEYSTAGESTIACNINKIAIEEFLDKEKKVCKTPDKLSDIPNYLIGLFAESVEKNSSVTFGDYTITKIDLTEEGKSGEPYLFVTKESAGKKSNYIFINGKFQKCDSFLCQYEKDGEGHITSPSLVLEVAPLRKTKTSTMKYYSIPLTVDGTSIDETSEEALALMHGIATDISAGQDSVSMGSAGQAFFVKDNREYAKDYKFSIKPIKVTREIKEEEREEEPPKREEEPKKEEEKKEEKKDDGKKEDKTKKKELDLSKPTEFLSDFAGIAGLFLMAGAMITPIGAVLAPVGLALGLGGVVGSQFAGNMKFKFMKKAKDKVKELEDKEKEDRTFSAHFIENENEVTRCEELSEAEQQEFIAMLDDNTSAIHAFTTAYDQYGIGFADDLVADNTLTRVAMLAGFDGYTLRQTMAGDLQAIAEAKSDTQRKQLVDNFMLTHFHSMPKAESQAVRKLFEVENQPAMTAFRKRIESLNSAHAKQQSAIDGQKERLSHVDDGALERIITSSRMDSAQRERFFRRYSPTIVERIARDKNMNEAKLTHLIATIPASDRQACAKILGETAQRVDAKLQRSTNIAREQTYATNVLKDSRAYASILADIEKNPSKYASFVDVVAQTKKFLLTHDVCFYKKADSIAKAKQFVANPAETTSLSAEAQAVCNVMNDVSSSIITANDDVKLAWKAIFSKIEERKVKVVDGKAVLQDSELETIAKSYRFEQPVSLYPDKNSTSTEHKTTIVEIARALGKTNEELAGFVARFDEAKKALLLDYQTNQIPQMLEKIKAELAIYGIDVKAEDVEKEAKSLMQKVGYFGEGNRQDIAQIKVQLEKKIALLKKEKTPANQQQLAHLLKVSKFVDSIVSGQLVETQIQASIMGAIAEIDGEITPEKASMKNQVQKNEEVINGAEKTDAQIKKFLSQDDRKQIKKLFKEKTEAGKSASDALAECLVEVLGDVKFEENAPTNAELIAKYTKDGKIDLGGLLKEISTAQSCVDARPAVEIASMAGDLSTKIATAKYEEQLESGKADKMVYSSVFDLVVAMAEAKGKTREDVLKAFEGKTGKKKKTAVKIDEVLKQLGIAKKDYEKRLKEVEIEGFSERAVVSAENVRKENDVCKKALEDLQQAWTTALESGDVSTLKTLLEGKGIDKILSEVGIDKKYIATIITKTGITPDKIKEELDGFDKGNLMFKKLTKAQQIRDIEANRASMIATLPTKEGREFAQAQFALASLDSAILEMQAKLNAITSLKDKGYDEALISQAMTAFADGDETFFIAHPEIKLEEPYFFSNQDDKLFSLLKIAKKKLKGKDRDKAIQEIKKALYEKRQKTVEAVEKMKKDMASSTQATAKVDGKFAKLFKKKIHLTSKVMEEVNKGMEAHSPVAEVSPQERLAQAGLVYDDDLTLEDL
ncbi:MAG: hypothetical protein J6C53_02265 [Clostridia bacterium]|nr:hypothetical protein [Clostridia bacterium]